MNTPNSSIVVNGVAEFPGNRVDLALFSQDAIAMLGEFAGLHFPEVSRFGNAIELGTETGRCADDMGECDGTTYIGGDAILAARKLGANYGFDKVQWDEIEKGWGVFYFGTKKEAK